MYIIPIDTKIGKHQVGIWAIKWDVTSNTWDKANPYYFPIKLNVVEKGETTCGDGIKNGDESDIDCGGLCPSCNIGNTCFVNSDCKSQYCNYNNICSIEEFCGDGKINFNKGEECDEGIGDGGKDNGQVCSPPYSGNCNFCSTTCKIVTLNGGFCGDGIKQGPEECDGGIGGITCIDIGIGFQGGVLSCTSSCTFDVSGCFK